MILRVSKSINIGINSSQTKKAWKVAISMMVCEPLVTLLLPLILHRLTYFPTSSTMATVAGVLAEVMAALQSFATHAIARVLSAHTTFIAAPVPSASELLVAHTTAFEIFPFVY